MKHRGILLLTFIGLISYQCSTPPPGDEERFKDRRVVLTVRDNKLTLGEVEKRFSATEFADAKAEYEAKEAFVEQFLDRFMLIEGAREAGFPPDLDSATYQNNLFRQYYIHKIVKNIEVTDADIEKFFAKYGGEYQAGHLVVRDKRLADSLYGAIVKGTEFEKLVAEFSLDESTKKRGGSTGYAMYSRFDRDFEEAVFALKIGEISKPIRTRRGWHIIKLYDRIKTTPADLEKNQRQYRDLTQRYLERLALDKFHRELRGRYHYRVVWPTIEFLISKSDSSRALGLLPDSLASAAYLNWYHFTDDELKLPVAEYDGGAATVSDFLTSLAGTPQELLFDIADSMTMENVLQEVAMPPLIDRMAREEGFDKSEGFQAELDYLRGSQLMQSMRDTLYHDLGEITEEDMARFHGEHQDEFYLPDQVRASAIAVKTRAEAEELLQRIRNGAIFIQLAGKYSVDKKTGAAGGDLGFFTVKRYTPLYEAAEGLRKGELGGPVEFEGNWWIFRVTGRIERQPKGLELVRAEVQSRIYQERRDSLYEQFLRQMKGEIPYTMDLELIKNNLKLGTYVGAKEPEG